MDSEFISIIGWLQSQIPSLELEIINSIWVNLWPDLIKQILAEVDFNRFQHPPIFEVSGKLPHTRRRKNNPSMSNQFCNMIALDFGSECTDLRHIYLNVINKQKMSFLWHLWLYSSVMDVTTTVYKPNI